MVSLVVQNANLPHEWSDLQGKHVVGFEGDDGVQRHTSGWLKGNNKRQQPLFRTGVWHRKDGHQLREGSLWSLRKRKTNKELEIHFGGGPKFQNASQCTKVKVGGQVPTVGNAQGITEPKLRKHAPPTFT